MIRRFTADPSPDFEALYSEIVARDPSLASELEKRIFEYFGRLRLPADPTLYDLLALSLTRDDVIATFNWDPLLPRALQRCARIGAMPHGIFLHGCTHLGTCFRHDTPTLGWRIRPCECGEPYQALPLLYPVLQKNYSADRAIQQMWTGLRRGLESAYLWTIFGYSAPRSDIDAIALLKEGWNAKRERVLEEIQIVDIREESELQAQWDEFIHSHHWRYSNSLNDSYIFEYPRRSCQALWSALMDCKPWEEAVWPTDLSWDSLRDWLSPIIEAERDEESNRHGTFDGVAPR